jgi:hypothetical protein
MEVGTWALESWPGWRFTWYYSPDIPWTCGYPLLVQSPLRSERAPPFWQRRELPRGGRWGPVEPDVLRAWVRGETGDYIERLWLAYPCLSLHLSRDIARLVVTMAPVSEERSLLAWAVQASARPTRRAAGAGCPGAASSAGAG